MKLIISCIVLFVVSFSTPQKNDTLAQEKTVYYFIRHAEKDVSDPTDRNPKLTKEGEIRAQQWVQLFADKEIDFVFSTDFHRTLQTAKPIAESHKLEISSYDYQNLYNSDFQNMTHGKTSVIIGHSNTTPQFINTILEKKKYTDIEESDYGKLFIITVVGDKISDIVKDIN